MFSVQHVHCELLYDDDDDDDDDCKHHLLGNPHPASHWTRHSPINNIWTRLQSSWRAEI